MTPAEEALALTLGLVSFMLLCGVGVFIGIALDRSRRAKTMRRRALDVEAAHAVTSRAVAGRTGPPPANGDGNGTVADITTLDGGVLRRFHSAGTCEVVHYGKREETKARLDEPFVVGEEGDMGIEMVDLQQDAGKNGLMMAPQVYAESIDDQKTDDAEKAGDGETGVGLGITGVRC